MSKRRNDMGSGYTGRYPKLSGNSHDRRKQRRAAERRAEKRENRIPGERKTRRTA